ncbi:hypothetical protein M3Y97_00015700 [Aphelenchoides bicaudatus]|nr:hypothetical protein M3Y97_00015700 [Aphelenchoides bicaudatus]
MSASFLILVFCVFVEAERTYLDPNREFYWQNEDINHRRPYYGQPEQVLLSFGGSVDKMFVTWVTFDDTNTSTVQYGLQMPMDKSVVAKVSLFVDGGKAKTKRYIHRVTISGIKPGKRYCAYVPYLTSVGNHEQIYNFSHYVNRFTAPGSDHGLFYSFDLGAAHFIALSSEFYYYLQYGTEQLKTQYNWLLNDLKEANANRKNVPWIVVYGHRAMYCTNKLGIECKLNIDIFRDGFVPNGSFGIEKLLYDYGVDMYIGAHQHVYERFWPIYNKTVYNGTDSPYTNPKAPVQLIVGSAGCIEVSQGFPKTADPISAFRSSDFGFGQFQVFNHTHLYYQQILAAEDRVQDSFWLIKDKHEPYPKLDWLGIVQSSSPSKLTITWLTYDDTQQSFVHRFVDGGRKRLVRYIHRAWIADIQAGERYFYRVGSDFGWSAIYNFVGLKERPNGGYRFAIYGDMGNINARSLGKVQRLAQDGNFDLVFHNGDLAYDLNDKDGKFGDEFLRQIEPVAAYVPYMISVGNHDRAYNYSHITNRFTMPGSEHSLFYSFDLGYTHMISLNTEFYYWTEWGTKQIENQWNWLYDDLDRANKNRKSIPWIIVFMHRTIYCTDVEGRCDENERRLREGINKKGSYALEKLFYSMGVDLIIGAHEHNYERFWPMYNYTVYNGTNSPYVDPPAPVLIVSGSAGCQWFEMWTAEGVAFGQLKDKLKVYKPVNDINAFGALDKQRTAKRAYKRITESARNKVKVDGPDDFIELPSMETFFDGCFYFSIENALQELSYDEPTVIQSVVIPYFFETTNDLLIQSQTGSGKTCAYLLPLIQQTIDLKRKLGSDCSRKYHSPIAVVLTTSRELAAQIYSEAMKLSKGSNLRVLLAVGETYIKDDLKILKQGCDILIGTQGRINHYFYGMNEQGDNKHLDFHRTHFLVLDEVDRQLRDEHFFIMLNQLSEGLENSGNDYRVSMFSATIDQKDVKKFLRDSVIQITIGDSDLPALSILQTFVCVEADLKIDYLRVLLKRLSKKCKRSRPDFLPKNARPLPKTIIYVNSKRQAVLLSILLLRDGYLTYSIESSMAMHLRMGAIRKLREDKIDVLISTDVGSRGLNVAVDVVINFDLPIANNFSEYTHRVGRTGRMGNFGRAISFFDPVSDADIAWGLVGDSQICWPRSA